MEEEAEKSRWRYLWFFSLYVHEKLCCAGGMQWICISDDKVWMVYILVCFCLIALYEWIDFAHFKVWSVSPAFHLRPIFALVLIPFIVCFYVAWSLKIFSATRRPSVAAAWTVPVKSSTSPVGSSAKYSPAKYMRWLAKGLFSFANERPW